MEIRIQLHTTTTDTLISKTRTVRDSSNSEDFLNLTQELRQISKENDFDFTSKSEENYEILSNSNSNDKFSSQGPVYFEGGAEIWETIQTVSLYSASLAGFLELFNSILPSFKEYIKDRKRGKKIKIKFGKYTIIAKDEADLKKALELITNLKKGKGKGKK